MKPRLWLLAIAMAGLMSFAHAGVFSDAPPSPLELQVVQSSPVAGGISVGLKMINHADHVFVIQRGVEVDYLASFKWAAQMTIQAVGSCSDFASAPSFNPQTLTRIEAGATLDVTPWDGSICGGQCPSACDANTRLGAGSYRFVVITAEGQRIPGPAFKIPAL